MNPIINKHNPYGAAHQTPDTIVVHAMGEHVITGPGEAEHAPDFLLRSRLSAHALIAPDGTTYRCRADGEGAYHAKGYNTNSLGIEIMVAGRHDYSTFARALATNWVTDAQYAAALSQCREWLGLHNITRVVRHSDISPGRKIDPGAGFPWARLLEDLGVNVGRALPAE